MLWLDTKGMSLAAQPIGKCKLRSHVTELNKNKKKLYHETKINDLNNDSKKLWSTLNEMLGKKAN